MEVPGSLFGLSVGCFGKQDCQICTETGRDGGGGWDSTGRSSPVHNVCPKNSGVILNRFAISKPSVTLWHPLKKE